MIKKTLIALAVIAAASAAAAPVELNANSKFFSLTNWAYKDDASPDMQLYNVGGFYIAGTPLSAQRVSILPSIRYSPNSVQFISKSGLPLDSSGAVNVNDVEAVEVTLAYDGNLPTREQSIGIVSQLGTTTAKPVARYIPFDFNFFSNPSYVNWGLPPAMRTAIQNGLSQLDQETRQADALYTAWQARNPQVVGIKNATIRGIINGEVVAETTSSDFLAPSGTLPVLYMKGLTQFQINRIKSGGLELQVDYTFQDTKTSMINAKFDFKTIMRRVIDDSYKRVTTKKSSGFQFLGMGNRKSTMKDQIRQTLTDQTTGGSYGNTAIVMDDANDEQIAMFTERFFPTLTREKVIENHLQAAADAQANGKSELAETHRKFAADLQADKLDLSVDTAKALEALNQNDYVGFIAHGLKIGSASNRGTFEYHRVLDASSKLITEDQWVHQMNTSVNRMVRQLVKVQSVDRKPFIGLCSAYNMRLGLFVGANNNPNWFPNPVPVNYFVPFCIVQNGPLANAGIAPGTLIEKIEGKTINNANDLRAALYGKRPGDTIDIVRLNQGSHPGVPGGVVFHRETVEVQLGAGDIAVNYQ